MEAVEPQNKYINLVDISGNNVSILDKDINYDIDYYDYENNIYENTLDKVCYNNCNLSPGKYKIERKSQQNNHYKWVC